MITRTIQIEFGKFRRVGLSKEEIDRAMNELLEFNHREIERVLKFAKIKNLSEDITKVLLDKQLLTCFTAITNALDEKIFLVKEEQKTDKKKIMEKLKEELSELRERL